MASKQQDPQQELADFSQFPCNVDFFGILDEGSVASFFDDIVLDDDVMSEDGSVQDSIIPTSYSDNMAKTAESLHMTSISMSGLKLDFANVGPAAELTDVFDNETTIRQSTYVQLQRLSDSMRRSEATRRLIIEHRQAMLFKNHDPQLIACCRSANTYMLAAKCTYHHGIGTTNCGGSAA